MGLSDLPVASGREIVGCLVNEFGLRLERRSKKGHRILNRAGFPLPISIPDHRQVERELLAADLNQARIAHREFAQKLNDR